MSVGNVCNREVVVAHGDDSIRDAIARMREYHVGTVVIVDDAEGDGQCVPIGIVTDRDIALAAWDSGASIDDRPIAEIMSSNLLIADEDDDTLDVVARMRERGIRRVPVVNDQGGLVGIVSVDDLLEVLTEELSGLAHIIGQEQRHEHIRLRS